MKNTKKIKKKANLKYKRFKADISMKRYTMSMSAKRLIDMINAFHDLDIDTNSEVIFGNNEGLFVVGKKEKNVSDLVINIMTKEKELHKFIWEFQTYYDSKMGERIMMYKANNFVKEKDGTLILVDSVILYFIMGKPATGYEGIKRKIGEFSVAGMDFGKDEVITAKTKYINVFKILFGKEEYDKRLEPLKILYIYKYKKQIKKLKTEDYKKVLNECQKYIEKLKGLEKSVANKIYCDIINDITNKIENLKDGKERYGEELKYMEEMHFGYSDALEKRGIEQGIEMGMIKGKVEILLQQEWSFEEIMKKVGIKKGELKKIVKELEKKQNA